MERRSSSGTDGPKTHTLVVTIGADQNEKVRALDGHTLAQARRHHLQSLQPGVTFAYMSAALVCAYVYTVQKDFESSGLL